MKQEIDIHNYVQRVQGGIRRMQNSKITDANKQAIMEFRDYCSLKGLSLARIDRYIGVLQLWAEILNADFLNATKQQIMSAVRVVHENPAYSPYTKATYKIMLKCFYRWLKDSGKNYPEEVGWIVAHVKKTEVKLVSNGELINENEVKMLVDAAEHPRDKALISCLYESGSRIGELASLQLCNIKFDEYGAILNVTGKTGPRPIRVIFSTSYLVTWINNHPLKDDLNAPLWLKHGHKNRRGPMCYAAIRKMLKELFIRTGIKKKRNPHLFRHSRATFMADHLTEFQMNQYFGWTQGSKMPSTYVHMSGKNLDSSILALNGIATPQIKKESGLKPKICPRCNTINNHDAKFCNSCAGIIDSKTAIEVEIATLKQAEAQKNTTELMSLLLKDREFNEMFNNKIKELGLNITPG